MTDPRNTRRWKTLSKAIIARDGVCIVCGTEGDASNPLSADHIIPMDAMPEKWNDPLVWDPENLQAMCRRHNSQKNNKVVGQTTDYINPVWLAWEANKLKERK